MPCRATRRIEKDALASSTPRERAASEDPGQERNGRRNDKESVHTVEKSAMSWD